MTILSCFKCDKPLEPVFPGSTENQPNNAMNFTSRGHYGTTVFDPLDNSLLEISICDDCVKEGRSKKNILYYPPTFNPRRNEIWTGQDILSEFPPIKEQL